MAPRAGAEPAPAARAGLGDRVADASRPIPVWPRGPCAPVAGWAPARGGERPGGAGPRTDPAGHRLAARPSHRRAARARVGGRPLEELKRIERRPGAHPHPRDDQRRRARGGQRRDPQVDSNRRRRGAAPRPGPGQHAPPRRARRRARQQGLVPVRGPPGARAGPLAACRADQRRDDGSQAGPRRAGPVHVLPRGLEAGAGRARDRPRQPPGRASSASRSRTSPARATPFTCWAAGCGELCSVAEPADRHALRVSALSCSGSMHFGLCTDPDALPGLDEVEAGIDAAIDELRERC